MNQLLILGFSVMTITGCNSEKSDSKGSVIEKNQKSVKVEQQVENNQTDCEIATQVDLFVDEIANNPSVYVNGKINDNCVLSLIDSLSIRAINTHQDKYFNALGAICSISDGYVSEYFLDIGVYQFYQNFNHLIDYTFQQSQKGENCLRKMIIEAISMQISDGGDKKEKEVVEFIERKIKEYHFPKEKVVFIKQLQKEFDPSMFD